MNPIIPCYIAAMMLILCMLMAVEGIMCKGKTLCPTCCASVWNISPYCAGCGTLFPAERNGHLRQILWIVLAFLVLSYNCI